MVDGDTIDVDETRYRLIGFDAPETYRAECAAERQLGNAATERLRTLVRDADELALISNGKEDRYGRSLAILEADGRDVSTVLIADRRGTCSPLFGRAARLMVLMQFGVLSHHFPVRQSYPVEFL